MPIATTSACATTRSTSSCLPAPRARATAAATPPPMPPAAMVCMSIIIGNVIDTPASESRPIRPTKKMSIMLTIASVTITTQLGPARRSSVETMGWPTITHQIWTSRLAGRARGAALDRAEARAAFEVRLVGQQQAGDDLATDQVLVDDLGDVGLGDLAVPDLLGVDHEGHAALALIEAPRVVGANDLGEP